MQESWEFILAENKIEQCSENFIRLILEKNKKELGIFLSYYYKREGAVAENVILDGSIDFISKFTGKFTVEFDLVHFNACLNIHDQKKEKMDLNFEIKQENSSLQLKGPYWPEREMDDI